MFRNLCETAIAAYRGRMPIGDVETYFADGMWHNRIDGTGEHLGLFATRDVEIGAGRQHVKKRRVEHIVKNMEGAIVERSSYREDVHGIPHPLDHAHE